MPDQPSPEEVKARREERLGRVAGDRSLEKEARFAKRGKGYLPSLGSEEGADRVARDPHKAEPETAEVESAALLANESAERLPSVDRETLHELADLFIAEGHDGGAEVFVPWARRHLARASGDS
jgi:hypothetical protein